MSKLENDYLNGELPANDYKRLNNKLITSKSKLDKEISKLNRQLGSIPKINLASLEKLCILDSIYNNSNNKDKNRLLKSVFPEGISINSDNKKVRTPKINSLLNPTNSKPTNYKHIEIKKGQDLAFRPVRGGKEDNVLTKHRQLLMLILS